MKTLCLVVLVSLSVSHVAKADVYENACITYQQAMNESASFPSTIAEADLPELKEGWQWIMVYQPSRDPELQFSHWMSWPDGKTLELCQ